MGVRPTVGVKGNGHERIGPFTEGNGGDVETPLGNLGPDSVDRDRRAVGDNPDSVDAQGLSVYALRTGAVVAGSALMALGGAFLTMSAFDAFFFGMVNGRGWICIALTVFASWRPGKALLGALLFGAFDAYQVRLQTQVGAFLPSQVFLMLPYLFAIVALVVVARKADYPRAMLIPWFKGTR